MHRASPDKSQPHPDQETIDAWQADATEKDKLKVRVQEVEETLARKRSRATPLLGWLLAGGALLQGVGAIFRQDMNLGGPLSLLAGIMILRGSQSWARAVAFTAPLLVLVFIAKILWPLYTGHPVKLGSRWYPYTDPLLWIRGVSPAAYLLGEAILAFVVLRHRRLRFWTGAVKGFAAAAVIVLIGAACYALHRDEKNKQLLDRFPNEVRMADKYLRTHGSSARAFHEIMSSPVIRDFTVFWEPNAKGISYLMKTPAEDADKNQIREATRWVKLPSGQWARIQLEFLIPELGT